MPAKSHFLADISIPPSDAIHCAIRSRPQAENTVSLPTWQAVLPDLHVRRNNRPASLHVDGIPFEVLLGLTSFLTTGMLAGAGVGIQPLRHRRPGRSPAL